MKDAVKFSDIPGFNLFVTWGIFVVLAMASLVGVVLHFLLKFW